jgi:hypothetical protein
MATNSVTIGVQLSLKRRAFPAPPAHTMLESVRDFLGPPSTDKSHHDARPGLMGRNDGALSCKTT